MAAPTISNSPINLIAYREGMAQRLAERLTQLRRERLAEEEQRQANQPKGDGVSLVVVQQSEEDYNTDYRYGYEPGTTARRRAERDARIAAAKAEREKWERENPEAAAAEAAARKAETDRWWKECLKKEERNARRRKGSGYRERKATPEEERARLGSYREGRVKAEDISLNRQVNKDDRNKIS